MSSSLTRFFSPSKFRKYLVENTSIEMFNIINATLISENAYIAGGSVLSCYSTNFETKDFDIYVNQSNFNNLIVKLNEIYKFSNMYTDSNLNLAPPYDDSFFKKNHILFRARGFCSTINVKYIDIMVIPDEINITDVLSNFDLTICEIWYNGRTIDGTDLEGIRNKIGRLRKEYNDSLFKNFNNFIIKRINKYRERGFTINYEHPLTEDFTVIINKKKVSNPNEWVIKKFIIWFHIMYDVYKRYLAKSSNPESALHPYHSLITRNNLHVKYYIFINSIKHFDNIDELYEKLKIYFIMRDPKNIFEKILNKFYQVLLKYNSTEYLRYIENLTDLKYNYEILSSNFESFKNYDFKCNREMIKYIRNFNEDIEVDSTIKKDYEILKEKNNNKCIDIIMFDDIDISTDYLDDNNIIFVFNNKFICYSKTNIDKFASDYLDNWFLECTGSFISGTNDKQVNNFDLDNIYIKIPLEINVFIHYKYILFILKNNYSVYFLNLDKKITHSISYKNINHSTANYIGANHCQDRSDLDIYKIKYCDIK